MNNQNDKTWFNQQLMYFKDLNLNSNGILEITLANNTNDFKSFSPLSLNIAITSNSNIRKMYSISYCNSVDMIMSFKEIISNANTIYNSSQKYEVTKKYYTDKLLKFEFVKSNNENIVIISIINDISDYSMIAIPYYVFSSIIGIIRSFANDYTSLNLNLVNRTVLAEILEQNKLIKNSIHVLPTSILEFYNRNNSNHNIQELPQDLNFSKIMEEPLNENISTVQLDESVNPGESNKNNINNDFDNFLADNINNISLGIDETPKEKSKYEESDNFITHFEKLENLENLLNSIVVHENPHIIIKDELEKISSTIKTISDISENEFKSYAYISNLVYKTIMKQYTESNIDIPANFQVIKYKTQDTNHENIDLAFDILSIISYLKCFRVKLQERESDSFRNKSIFLLTVRTFLDIYGFSYIENMNKESIRNMVLSKFKHMKNKNFFKSYDDILGLYNLPEISENEIDAFISAVCEKIVGNNVYINNYHNNLYSNNLARLDFNNNFNIEQIINYIIPLEVCEKIGINIFEKENIDKILDSSKIPNEVFEIFKDKNKSKKNDDKIKDNMTNILRYCKLHDVDIPKHIREEFLIYIKELEFNNFDFNNSKFLIDDFGEKLLIGLYEWNNSENKKELYKNFCEKAELSTMNKDLIISKYKTKFDLMVDDTNWSSMLE